MVKRGQITVFIILGMLLLVAFSTAIYIMNYIATTVNGDSPFNNPRLDDVLGCNEAYEKYEQIRTDTINEGVDSGLITSGTKEEFDRGEVDFYKISLGDSGFSSSGLNIHDEVVLETMQEIMEEKIGEVDDYYGGLVIGSEADLKRDSSSKPKITSLTIPYFAAMKVIEVNYKNELEELQNEYGRPLSEIELLAFGENQGFDFNCNELPDSEFREITC